MNDDFTDEVRRQFMKEFDYRKEAANQEAIRLGLSQAGFGAVVVPKPYSELCTREVLVMEYIPGVKLTDVVRQRPKAPAKGTAKGTAKGAATATAAPAALGGGESWWGRTIGAYFSRRYARSLVDEVVRVHGYQVLKMGLFNGKCMAWVQALYHQEVRTPRPRQSNRPSDHPIHAVRTGDPHPGNLLLMPSGKLGLIDYGQIKALNPAQRRCLARIIVALADGKTQEVIDLFVQMGFRSQVRRQARHGWTICHMYERVLTSIHIRLLHNKQRMDPEVISAVASLYFDRDDAKVTKGINLQVFFETLQKRDPFLGGWLV